MDTKHMAAPPRKESELRQELRSVEELRIMNLAAISTASIQNTESTIKERITNDNPYWTVAYADVCRAIDREMELRNKLEQPGCTMAGPGRGDCEHFVGLPGMSIPGQHDGPDDTVDEFGKPNGWCWSCWKDYKILQLEIKLRGR